VDSVATLDVMAGMLEVMRAYGHDDGQTLEFTGLEVIDKCAQITAWATGATLDQVAALTARSARAITNRSTTAPRGATKAVERARAGLVALDLPPGGAKVQCAGRDLQLDLEEPTESPPRESMESLRVRVLRVGGREPRVAVEDVILRERFTLRTTEAKARQAAENLYQDVQVDVHISRDADGNVVKDGRLLSVREVAPLGSAIETWRAWVRGLDVDPADIEAERAATDEPGAKPDLLDAVLGDGP